MYFSVILVQNCILWSTERCYNQLSSAENVRWEKTMRLPSDVTASLDPGLSLWGGVWICSILQRREQRKESVLLLISKYKRKLEPRRLPDSEVQTAASGGGNPFPVSLRGVQDVRLPVCVCECRVLQASCTPHSPLNSRGSHSEAQMWAEPLIRVQQQLICSVSAPQLHRPLPGVYYKRLYFYKSWYRHPHRDTVKCSKQMKNRPQDLWPECIYMHTTCIWSLAWS